MTKGRKAGRKKAPKARPVKKSARKEKVHGEAGRYMALGQELSPNDYVMCVYKVITDMPLDMAANAIAAEESTGTWTKVVSTDEDIIKRYGALVTKVEKAKGVKGGGIITLGYPKEDFNMEVGGIPQLLSIVAGNLFGLESLSKIRLEAMTLPLSMVRSFKGPKFGIDGVRHILDRPKGFPFLGTIVKPKIGLDPKRFANYVYESGMGGLTNSKDDETLVDQAFCPLEARCVAVAEAIDKVRSETGHKMLHALNISTRVDDMVDLGERAQSLGASQLMIDVFTTGFTAVQAVAEAPSIKLPIHVHRAMHAAITRDPWHGISMAVISQIVRLAGGDGLHVGTFGVGKMAGTPEEERPNAIALTAPLGDIKPVIPVASGGLYPGLVGELVKRAGADIQIQAGGGVSGHPDGIRGGARAMVQAAEAAVKGIDAREYARDHRELRLALEKWGGMDERDFSY